MSKSDLLSRGQAIQNRKWASRKARAQIVVAAATTGFLAGGWLGAATAPATHAGPAHEYAEAKIYELKHPFLRMQRTPEAANAVWWIDRYTQTGSPWEIAADKVLRRATKTGGGGAMLFGCGIYFLQRRRWISVARATEAERVMRGGKVIDSAQLAQVISIDTKEARITMAGVPIPKCEEGRHTLLVGRTGCGKSTLLRSICYQIAERGDHAIVYDGDGSFVARFYQPERGDIILNPYDARAARWDIFEDVRSAADADRIASFIVPKPANAGESNIWHDQARAVVAAIIDRLRTQGSATIDHLDRALRSATVAELRVLVAGTAAARAFEPNAEKATASVLFTMGEAAKIVSLLAEMPSASPSFSFDRFHESLVTSEVARPWIFISAPKRSFAAARPILAAWLDCAASAILEGSTTQPSRAWFIIDELPSLPRVSSLLVLLPEGRKYGAACILAFQSMSQLRETYGQHGASTIVGQTATQIIMQAGDPETAKWGQDLFGSAEVEARRASETLDTGELVDKGTLSTQRETKPLVLDSQFTGLGMGEGYMRLSGFPVARVRVSVEYEHRPETAIPFVPRLDLERIDKPIVATGARRIEDEDNWLDLGGPI